MTTRQLNVRFITEGSPQDPYGVNELIAVVNGIYYTLRLSSLGYNRYSVNNVVISEEPSDIAPHATDPVTMWTRKSGLTPDKFMKYYERLHPYFHDAFYGHA